jgi:hypothetical protein
VEPATADDGLIEVITGVERTVKLVDELAVEEATITDIGPEVAPTGTRTVRLLAVAAVTVASVPLNLTILDVSVVLKFWPWIVIALPIPPDCGVKFSIARLPTAGALPRVTWTIFPTAS